MPQEPAYFNESENYDKAANLVKEYLANHTVQFKFTEDEITKMLADFRAKFAPEVLSSLSDDLLLNSMFLTGDGNNDSLCWNLEYNPKLKRAFGSISGGSSKFDLFQRLEDRQWITGGLQSQRALSEEEAQQIGRTIRDNLVKACEMIHSRPLDTVTDYEKLDDELRSLMRSLASHAWVRKYLHLIFPDKFVGWYTRDWLKHLLFGFGIFPSEKDYGMSGQLALVKKRTGTSSPDFYDICQTMFGEVRHFFRLGCSGNNVCYADEWKKKGIVAVGWGGFDLRGYVKNGELDKKNTAEALVAEGVQKGTATRKAGELKSFYETSSSSVMVVMDGERLFGLVDELSPYMYVTNDPSPHQKSGVWHTPFTEADRLPEKEAIQTTCVEIKKAANLLFLYRKYYWPETAEPIPNTPPELRPIAFHTGYQSPFERNRILFGAPGTGKSYTLNGDRRELVGEDNEDDYERVTFHPDYSYAHFVGTYKPVPTVDRQGNDAVTYAYVPGPFMRVYVKALKNSRTANIRPFLLIIEEINRANVAAVFGDIFQLLDRGADNVSEYPIQASEDVKDYLARELGGVPGDYAKLRLPDNMFIWATMNSADQGVFPMDTAFKRRWDFTYLGIDASEDGIRGKYVYLGNDSSQKVEWNRLRKAINNFLARQKINEDKQLGPYFISSAVTVPPEGDEIDRDTFIRVFKNKVIMYLFEDAARQKRAALFAGCSPNNTRFSDICAAFDKKGINIFNDEIVHETEAQESPAPDA